MNIERTILGSDTLEPHPWRTREVKAFYFDDGTPSCFCAMRGEGQRRENLDPEFFNHELMELDVGDPEDIARFLSKYGMFEDARVRPFEVQDEFGLKLSVYASFGLCPTPPHFDYLPNTLKGRKSQPARKWLRDQIREDYPSGSGFGDAYANAMLEFDGGFPTFDSLGLDESSLVQYEAVVNEIEFFRLCRQMYALMLEFDEVEVIAEKSGQTPEDFLMLIHDLDTRINMFLRNCAPEIGFDIDGKYRFHTLHQLKPDPSDLALSSNGFEEARTFKPGSISQTLALQLLKFTSTSEHWRKCEKCGQVFKIRRTKGTTQRTRSNATTCCDKCRNALNQQNHRNSPGYKNKQKQKKQVDE